MRTLFRISLLFTVFLLCAVVPDARSQSGNCPGGAAANCGLGWVVSPTQVTISAVAGSHAYAPLTFTQTQGAYPFYYNFQIVSAFSNDFAIQQSSNGPPICNYGTPDSSPCGLELQYSPSTSGNESASITFFASGGGSNLTISVNGSTISPPTISGFTPGSGPGGTQVIISGSNFSTTTFVTFNGVVASFTINSDGQITAVVPGTATTGLIAVTNPAGTATSATNFIVTAQDPSGKWVLFLTNPTPAITGLRCYDSNSETCYNLFFDVSSNLTSPSDSSNPPYVLAFDNLACFSNGPILNLAMSFSNGQNNPVGWDVFLQDAATWTVFFAGGNLTPSNFGAFNFDGSTAPFFGTAQTLSGTQTTSGGCPGAAGGIPFEAVWFPSLNAADVSLTVLSQPGTVNAQQLQISLPIQENSDFTIDGTSTGVLSGPACGPLSLTITDGESVGPLSEVEGTYTNPAGGNGTWSVGWDMVTPYTVSQTDLINAGYQATGPGLPLQIWTVDYSASSDGSCSSDPVILGTGVAYLKHQTKRLDHPRNPRHKKDFDWKKFRDKFDNARATNDRSSAHGGKHD